MTTTDQVAGEAREKLADELLEQIINLGIARGYDECSYIDEEKEAEFAHHRAKCREKLIAALRAQMERGAEEMRKAAFAWVREDIPLSVKMMLRPEHIKALIERVKAALPLHPGKEGGGHGSR